MQKDMYSKKRQQQQNENTHVAQSPIIIKLDFSEPSTPSANTIKKPNTPYLNPTLHDHINDDGVNSNDQNHLYVDNSSEDGRVYNNEQNLFVDNSSEDGGLGDDISIAAYHDM